MHLRLRLMSAMLLVAGPVLADADYVGRRKIEPARFGELVDVLSQEMRAGGRFEYVSAAERARIDAALARIGAVLEGKRTLAELRDPERVAVFNAQEEVNGILARRDRERLVCEHRKTVGSHRKTTVCETYGERMARIKGSRERVDGLNRRIQACREQTIPGTAPNAGNAGVVCTGG